MTWRPPYIRHRAILALDIVRTVVLAVRVELGVRRVPLPRLAAQLGIRLTPGPVPGTFAVPQRLRQRARRARSLMRRWPFARGTCLREALVVGHVLRQLEPVLRIGVGQRAGTITAHAWLEVGGEQVGARHGYRPLDISGPAAKP